MGNEKSSFDRRKQRTRFQLRKVANGRPRLSVFRSNKHIYAQIIDDLIGETVASASSNETRLRGDVSNGSNKSAAAKIGALVAERAIAAGITEVVFDRGGYIFHGRVKAVADAARDGGLKF